MILISLGRASALAGILAVFGTVGVAWAQRVTGAISGTVSDPSGAVVPNAQVTIVNEQTGFKRSGATNEVGFYSFRGLEAGVYTVTVTAPGFKTSERKGISLHVADDRVVPVVLELGAPTESVTVVGGAPLVETRSGEVYNLIQREQILELPLNGRSFVQLTLLVPGAAPADNQNSRFTGLLGGVDISMSGNPANSNAWLVDGVDNVDHGSGRTILVYPSVDSIEEFKVQRNSYGADMPAAGGAVINLVTKGGTNEFHGSVYEFFRNDKLNANNFFLNKAGKEKGKLRSNNFGYSVGGPIKKDKLFFFWSHEWRREVRGVTRQSSVPTDKERVGDFSPPRSVFNPQQPINPFTGLPFPNDKIPADLLSPAGLAILKLYPRENNPGQVFNWVEAVATKLNTRQEQIRVDYNISSSTNLMARFTNDAWSNPAPNYGTDGGLWGDTGFPTVDSSWEQPSKSLAVRLTQTLSPTTVNTFQFSYSNNRIFITRGMGEEINREIVSKVASVFPGVPNKTHAIFWGAPETGIGANLWNAAPWDNAHDIFTWKDDFSKISGNHTFKVGAFVSLPTKKDEDCCGANVTTPQFWGPTAIPGGAGVGGGWGPAEAPGNGSVVTGNGLADLLLKGAYWGGSEQSSQPRAKIRWKNIEVYYADTWRVTPRLTLDYGVRWSILPPSVQADNRIANFIPSLYDPKLGANPFNGLIFPKELRMPDQGIQGGSANLRGIDVGRGLRKSGYNTIAPRLGIAFDPTGAGKWAIRIGAGFFYGRADLSQPIGQMLLNPPFNATINFANGRPLDALPRVLPTVGVGTPTDGVDTNWKIQGSYQWNFTIERELFRDTKLEVAYVGNRGHHLPMNWDLNLVPPEKRLQWALLNYTPGSDTTLRDSLRSFFPLKGTNTLFFQSNGGNSSYHAFQTYLTKRFSNNFSLGASYSFSKLLSIVSLNCCGNGGGARLVDPWNFRYNRGPADFDRPHIFTMNVIYKFPELLHKPAAQRFFLGGWETTAIYSYATGIPLTVTISGADVGVSGNRPDLIASPKGPNTADGGWLNPRAFVVPQLGRLGTAGQGILHGPPSNQADIAIYKNFKIKEKRAIQFRFETFNTFNHTQFFAGSVNTNYQVSGLTTLDPATGQPTNRFTGCNALPGRSFPDCNTNPGFGLPTRARDPREIQFALKFIF
ncbi:MAG: carboxypeptidase regulatory-like domain-containing protein [Bryobacteraceae bacterium]|jgi:hypothetical protein|nr:carboxypeptidase regulatory-like domain-containing protein [Bryobacteraceae bacterium]